MDTTSSQEMKKAIRNAEETLQSVISESEQYRTKNKDASDNNTSIDTILSKPGEKPSAIQIPSPKASDYTKQVQYVFEHQRWYLIGG
jgi:serine/threonine protein phosphatase PrpC